uniref:Putative secreted protein n=1 Tax=Anopheles darlingi TaxID=43151 RepID=A0A2M4DIN8_ANODA
MVWIFFPRPRFLVVLFLFPLYRLPISGGLGAFPLYSSHSPTPHHEVHAGLCPSFAFLGFSTPLPLRGRSG